jgi:hypothetical protein
MHEMFFENLRNPARVRRAGVMRKCFMNHVYSNAAKLSKTGVKLDDVPHLAHLQRARAARALDVQLAALDPPRDVAGKARPAEFARVPCVAKHSVRYKTFRNMSLQPLA